MRIIVLLFAVPSLCFAQFEKVWEISVPGSTTSDATLGDLDGDGDLDAVLLQDLQNSAVLINQGSGYFTPGPAVPVMPRGISGRLGDLNGDTHLDLFVAKALSACEVWFGDGSGGFSDSGQTIGGNVARNDIELVDVDGDLYLDAILPANDSSSPNEIWLNDGSGNFTNSGQSLGFNFTQAVATGDVNGDTFPDLVFGNNGGNQIWLNNGSGVFSLSPSAAGAGGTTDILLRDLDGDTVPDIVVINGSITGEANEIWLNGGSGTFSNTLQQLGSSFSLSGALGDLDGDGDADLIEGTAGDQQNVIWLNDGNGMFTDSGNALGVSRINRISVADFNCDPGDDFLMVSSEGPSLVYFGSGNGVPNDSGQRFGSLEASCGAAGDMDGDGDLDVVLGSLGGVIRVLLNDGGGRFSDAGLALYNGSGNNNGAIAVADLNGDTRLDIVSANNLRSVNGDERDRIWINDGNGGFTLDPDFLDDQNGSAVAVADMNADTFPDIIIGNGNDDNGNPGTNSIWLNDGAGNFTEVNTLGIGNAKSLAVADFNGDTSPDVFVGNTGNEPNRIWLNNGTGFFTATPQGLGNSRTNVCVAFDFDGVNGPDVFCGNFNQQSRLWLNDGSGGFTDSGQNIGSDPTRSAAAVDANGDGIRDLFIGNGVNTASTDFARINDGDGNFSFFQALDTDEPTSAVLAGDFTGDGVEDVFTSSEFGGHALWNRAAVCPDVVAYAASFSLTGNDTLATADPDLDGLPNYLELAYNLNPAFKDAETIQNFATATKGLPLLTVTGSGATRTFRAEFIRRRNASCFSYDLALSPCLQGFVPLGPLSVSSQTINTNYERVTYLFTPPAGNPRFFGRFELKYEP